MAAAPPPKRPQELVDQGLMHTLSMYDFKPDQRMVEEALMIDKPTQTQQGGICEPAVPGRASQFGRR